MKATKVVPENHPKRMELNWQTCLICLAQIPHPYGRNSEGWTCSRKCSDEYDRRQTHLRLLGGKDE